MGGRAGKRSGWSVRVVSEGPLGAEAVQTDPFEEPLHRPPVAGVQGVHRGRWGLAPGAPPVIAFRHHGPQVSVW